MREVYRAFGGLVYAVAYRVLGTRNLAEEAAQQAFLQAWRNAGSFDTSREPGPWFATIARRAAIDVHRREARQEHDTMGDADRSDPKVMTIPDAAQRSYDVWEVRAAVDDLPKEERDVVRLQHLDGFTHTEIAERLGIPVGTVKSRSSRAHHRLADRLGHLREGAE